MSMWESYERKMEALGSTKRSASFKRETHFVETKLKESLSYQHALIDAEDREVAIIDLDNLNEKKIISLPGENIRCGALVRWADNYWLVNEKDANNEIYTRAKLLQCNYLLKWVDERDNIREQWCVIEDGTKYLTGELEDRKFIVSRGDLRISMKIGRNEYTEKFNRKNRFIIDDMESEKMMAYHLTKCLKVGNHYNGEGYYHFILQEVNSTPDDNMDLGIADYYKHFPKPSITARDFEQTEYIVDKDLNKDGKKVWI